METPTPVPADASPLWLPDARVQRAPLSYAARRVPDAARCQLQRDCAPRAGDLVLARVEMLGHHTRLHLPDGRRRQLFAGDEVVLVYADRYAPSQFEAVVPSRLDPCHLVAAGGIAARVVEQHARIRRGPTLVRPLGLVTSEPDGPPLNVAAWALPQPPPARAGAIPTFAAVGTSMDAGKTTAAAFLARGLSRLGLRVGYAKVTGTGAAGDPWLLRDAGADPVLDFTDAGYASTYRVPAPAVEAVFRELVGHLQHSGVDVALVEVADGLFQGETRDLLSGPRFGELVDGVLLAARDALGAAAGADWLAARGHRPLALAGAIEVAPLQRREAEEATGLPAYRRADLADPVTAEKLLEALRDRVR